MPLTKHVDDHTPEVLVVSEQDIYYEKLSHLNPAKASGPDGIPNWISVFGDNSFMNYAAPVFHYLRGVGGQKLDLI